MRFVVVDGCPVPARLAPFVRAILKESKSHLNSAYRGEAAKELLHKLGKHTQKELYDGFIKGLPGYLPANPPGRSTHELKNDGVAYSKQKPGGTLPHQWVPGAALPWWACGLDINDADVDRFIKVANRHGFVVNHTYPKWHREYHHVNFRKPPLMVRLRSFTNIIWGN